MDKVKIIYYNSTLLKGGTDTYMLEVVRNIDKSKFQVDVLIKDGDNVDKHIYEELKNLGSEVFLAKGSFVKRICYLRKFFKQHKHKYDVCHINATSQGTGIISYFAKSVGKIKKVIFHSHMGGNDHERSLVDKIGAKLMFKYSTGFASCSKIASIFMFGKSFCESNNILKLNNAVNTDKFKFDQSIRNKMRNELNLAENELAILHVGRFAYQKNHKRLLEIFDSVLKLNNNSKLILIGDGDLFESVQNQAQELKINKNIIFLGLKNNVNDYMQAADCFVMPSIHEGLPLVAVEAQASGLPCILSSNISTETKLADYVEFVGLEENNSVWAESILKSTNKTRETGAEIIKQHSFDHQSAIQIIENLYLNQKDSN